MNDIIQHNAMKRGMFSLWLNWTFPLASVMLIIFIAPYFSKIVTAIFCFVVVLVFHGLIRNNRLRESPFCFLIPYIVEISLFWVGSSILFFEIFGGNIITELSGQPYNHRTPIMPILFFTPIASLVTLWIKIRNYKNTFCTDCVARMGVTTERSLLGKIYSKEAQLQVLLILIISVGLAVVVWYHYFSSYINTDFNRRDKYVFVYLPVCVFFVSLLALGIRYYNIRKFLLSKDCQTSTIIRFLIISGEKFFLVNDGSLIDTPAKITQKFTASHSDVKPEDVFQNINYIKNFTIKFLYQSADYRTVSNIFHYAAFVPEESMGEFKGGQWIDLEQLQFLLGLNILSQQFLLELSRIYTTAITWKTYDKSGKRRYKIKHYKPTFRLSDMKNWDVDFNDPTWLYVSVVNEDKPFYFIRSLWHKYISGVLN